MTQCVKSSPQPFEALRILGTIEEFHNLYPKLVAYFNTNLVAKKSSTKLFSVTQQEGESTQKYLKRFNENMYKVEKLIELIVLEALMRGVREHVI